MQALASSSEVEPRAHEFRDAWGFAWFIGRRSSVRSLQFVWCSSECPKPGLFWHRLAATPSVRDLLSGCLPYAARGSLSCAPFPVGWLILIQFPGPLSAAPVPFFRLHAPCLTLLMAFALHSLRAHARSGGSNVGGATCLHAR